MERLEKFGRKIADLFLDGGFGVEKHSESHYVITDNGTRPDKHIVGSIKVDNDGKATITLNGDKNKHRSFNKVLRVPTYDTDIGSNLAETAKEVRAMIKDYKDNEKSVYGDVVGDEFKNFNTYLAKYNINNLENK